MEPTKEEIREIMVDAIKTEGPKILQKRIGKIKQIVEEKICSEVKMRLSETYGVTIWLATKDIERMRELKQKGKGIQFISNDATGKVTHQHTPGEFTPGDTIEVEIDVLNARIEDEPPLQPNTLP